MDNSVRATMFQVWDVTNAFHNYIVGTFASLAEANALVDRLYKQPGMRVLKIKEVR